MLIHNNKIFDPIREKSIERINILRPLIGKTFLDTDMHKAKMKGSRWYDDQRVFYTACGESMGGVFNNRLSEKDGLKKMQNMDQQKFDQLLIDALLDAAKADYWYRYEKQWD